jgi:hypothetical protein
MIISTLEKKKSTYLENTNYYYYSCNYKFYDGYKTLVVNRIVNIITLPIDIIHYLGINILSIVFIELPQIIYYSPYIIYYGLDNLLTLFDNYLYKLYN